MPNEYEIEIVETNLIDGGIEIFARAWKNGVQLGFGEDGSVDIERFRIFNPPVLVEDPLGDIVRTWVNERTGETETRTLREDPEEATHETLVHTVKLTGKLGTKIVKGKVGNTTSTFYPDANPETTSVDGRADRGGVNESWATIHAGAGNSGQDSAASGDICWIYMTTTINQFGTLERSFYLFDTSSIPDTDTISSATLSIYGQAKDDPSSVSPTINIFASSPASNVAIANSDYANVSSTAFSTAITYASFSTSAYNDFALNASGLAAISKTGVSKFSARNNYDSSNTAPTWTSNKWFGFGGYFADQTGTANDPKLVVVHSAPAATFTPRVSFIM